MAEQTVAIDNEYFGTYLRRRREQLGLSLKDVAERANLSYGFIARVEKGQSGITAEALGRLLAALNVVMYAYNLEDIQAQNAAQQMVVQDES